MLAMALSKSKQAESEYYARLGEDGIAHSLKKPFSDDNCAQYLANLAALFGLIEPPPQKIVDFGCGTGWLSLCLAQRGYDVLGVDLSQDAILCAQREAASRSLANARFITADYEAFAEDGVYDYAIFHDALHHAESEVAALQCAFRALRKGGSAIVIEPGRGHHLAASSKRAVEDFGVHEKEMHPSRVISAAKKAGFRRHLVLPFPFHHNRFIYRRAYHGITSSGELSRRRLLGALRVIRQFLPGQRDGLVILWK
jgi:SAM-dependent methyltransferase